MGRNRSTAVIERDFMSNLIAKAKKIRPLHYPCTDGRCDIAPCNNTPIMSVYFIDENWKLCKDHSKEYFAGANLYEE